MVNMFKDNVRGVLAGVCCAAVVMCGDVRGMEIVDVNLQNKCSSIDLTPINVDFPFFVGNSSGLTPIKWREMLEFISPNIAFLSKDSNADDIGCALGAVVTFCCPLVLGSFMCFADSEYFDLESANRAIAFLNLFPKILVPEVIAKVITHEDCHDVDKCLRLLSDIREPLEQLVANLLPNRKPFLSVTELEVFHCVAASF